MMHGFPMLETMHKLMDDEEKERKKLEKRASGTLVRGSY
jgi:hypothetical protein